MKPRPFPEVGDRIRKFCGPRNPNNWMCAAVVLAVVPGECLLVRRWLPRKRYHAYQAIDAIEWSLMAFVHLPKRGNSIALPRSWRHLTGIKMEGPPRA